MGRECRFSAPAIFGYRRTHDQTLSFEPVDTSGETTATGEDLVGQIRHADTVLVQESVEHFDLAEGQIGKGSQIGSHLLSDGGLRRFKRTPCTIMGDQQHALPWPDNSRSDII